MSKFNQSIKELSLMVEQMEQYYFQGEYLKAAHLKSAIEKGIRAQSLQLELKASRIKQTS